MNTTNGRVPQKAASIKPTDTFTVQEFHEMFLQSRFNIVEACMFIGSYLKDNPNRITDPSLRLAWGKYKGLKVDEVIELDAPYLEYMMRLQAPDATPWMQRYHLQVYNYLKSKDF